MRTSIPRGTPCRRAKFWVEVGTSCKRDDRRSYLTPVHPWSTPTTSTRATLSLGAADWRGAVGRVFEVHRPGWRACGRARRWRRVHDEHAGSRTADDTDSSSSAESSSSEPSDPTTATDTTTSTTTSATTSTDSASPSDPASAGDSPAELARGLCRARAAPIPEATGPTPPRRVRKARPRQPHPAHRRVASRQRRPRRPTRLPRRRPTRLPRRWPHQIRLRRP